MMFPCPGWTSPQAYKTERGASTTAVSVVIPVYNQRAYIEEVLLRVQAVQLDTEVLVIDDGSADGTRELLNSKRFLKREPKRQYKTARSFFPSTVFTLSSRTWNRGKVAALRRGFEMATGEIILVQDADLKHDPGDYHKLLAPIFAGRAEVVYGFTVSRRPAGGARFLALHRQ